MKKILILLLAFILPAVAGAYDEKAYDAEIDGIYYNFDKNAKTATVTCYSWYTNLGAYSGTVDIPPTVDYNGETYDVTSIGYRAFSDCFGLTSVTIPGSVTSIGDDAFLGCSDLTSVTIPNSVTSIGDYAFYDCSGLTSVTIPGSVTSIGDYAFSGCRINTINIMDLSAWSVSNLGTEISSSYHLQLNGTEIKNLKVPSDVTAIGESAFKGCSYLTSVTIPGSVTSIGESAFRDCSGLTSVTISGSVTSIGREAFFGCWGLTSVNISDLEVWCKISFGSDANPLNYAHHLYLNGKEITKLVIPSSVTRIGDYAFYGCSGLTSVTISDGVKSIGNSAFSGCSGLTSVTIPGSVTSIGYYAFSGCRINTINIMDLSAWSVSNLGTEISSSYHLQLNGTEIKNLKVPSDVTAIGKSAFKGCSYLTSVTIPGSVTSIGREAFFGCRGLTSVTIPNSVTSIGESAFEYCSGLTSVTIPDGVTSIGEGAFSGCTSIMTVKSYIKEPFNVKGLFTDETYRQGTLYIPQGTKDLYIRFDGWREFLKIEEMENEPAPNGQCATPTIIALGSRFKFQCETPGAEFTSSLTTEENFTGDEVVMDNDMITYTLTVYATAPGYDQSSPAKYRFAINKKDVNLDGNIDVADIATIIDAMADKSRKESY